MLTTGFVRAAQIPLVGSVKLSSMTCTAIPQRSGSSAAEPSSCETHTRLARHAWSPEDLAVLPQHLRPMTGETLDLILRKRVFLLQSRRGYRANTDSQVLAFFAVQRLRRRFSAWTKPFNVVDLGAGNGLVAILFALSLRHRADVPLLHLLELQESLADRARRNLELNGVHRESHVHLVDVADGKVPKNLERKSSVVLCNPPFYEVFRRTPPRQEEKRKAYFESSATIRDFAKAARNLLADDTTSRAFWIFPAEEHSRIVDGFNQSGLAVVSQTELFHENTDDGPIRLLYETAIGHSDNLSPSIDQMILHPHGIYNIYGLEMEAHLQELPEPPWKIGQLRQ
mmetsp:Transcript_6077/g.14734  ORF Transcript_6077/g.14734 Transcript_6077/m.14734 type:complete len:341 (-) Transcript_6077:1246-2268(-)